MQWNIMKLDLMKQDELLNKLSNIKIGKKTTKQKEWLIILLYFTILEKKLLIFFRDYGKMILDAAHKSNK